MSDALGPTALALAALLARLAACPREAWAQSTASTAAGAPSVTPLDATSPDAADGASVLGVTTAATAAPSPTPSPATMVATSSAPTALHAATMPAPLARSSRASTPSARTPSVRRWGIGLEVAPVDSPLGHTGIPLGGDESGFHLGLAFTFRWQANAHSAVVAGLGVPHAALGLGAWIGYEAALRVVADRAEIVALELYESSSIQFGFAGPDYLATRSDAFENHFYSVAGPPELALRLGTGARLRWARGLFDTYLEAVPMVTVTPALEPLFELASGVRVRF